MQVPSQIQLPSVCELNEEVKLSGFVRSRSWTEMNKVLDCLLFQHKEDLNQHLRVRR